MISIDPFDSTFLCVEQQALVRLIAKVEQYQAQNRFWEAIAMERAVGIVYHCLKSDYQDTKPTGWSEL
jgi:hypothetical protein